MLGPNRTSSLMTIGSFFKRKKKSSPYGPYLPGTFHHEEVVRRRTLSRASRKGHRTSSHNGSTHLTPPYCWSLLPCFHEASSQLLGLSIAFYSSQNVIFASRIIKLFPSVLACVHGPQGSCLLSLLRFFTLLSPLPKALLITL